MQVVKRNPLFRVLAFVLMVLILIMPMLIPHAQAALVETLIVKYGAEILAVILGAISGLAFGTGGELYAAADQCLMWLERHNVPAYETVIDMATWCVGNPTKVSTTGIRVSLDLWNALVSSPLGELLTVDAAGSKSIAVSGGMYTVNLADDFLRYVDPVITNAKGEVYTFELGSIDEVVPYGSQYKIPLRCYKSGELYQTFMPYADLDALKRYVVGDFSDSSYPNDNGGWIIRSDAGKQETMIFIGFLTSNPPTSQYSHVRWLGGFGQTSFNPAADEWPLVVGGAAIPIPVDGDLTYPGDDFLVKAPDIPSVETDEDGKEVVVIPDISVNPADHTMDLPKDDVGDVVDVPTDQLVDVTTGEIVDEIDTPDVPDVPTPPVGPDWPDGGDISIPKMIADKFPFCLPFVLLQFIRLLQAEPIEPVFRFPVKYGNLVDEEIVLDLSKWSNVVAIVRWGELVCFVAGLAYVTKHYIKW